MEIQVQIFMVTNITIRFAQCISCDAGTGFFRLYYSLVFTCFACADQISSISWLKMIIEICQTENRMAVGRMFLLFKIFSTSWWMCMIKNLLKLKVKRYFEWDLCLRNYYLSQNRKLYKKNPVNFWV